MELYPSLKNLSADNYWPGQNHPFIQQINEPRDTPHVNTRLKLQNGAYVTQRNTTAFNHALVDSTGMLCQQDSETLKHIMTECNVLEDVRGPVLESLKIVSEYDQDIPQSQNADNSVAPRGRAAQPSRDTRKTNKAK